MILLLLSCTGAPTEPTHPTPHTGVTGVTGATGLPGVTGDTSTSPPTADTGPPEPSVDRIDVALEGRCPGVDPRPVMPVGTGLHRVTLTDASARCNDGSPPVLYVRAATDPAHAADWVLHLDGGAECGSQEGCATRWCGEDFYDAGKMSTRWAPMNAGAEGIVGTDPGNTFAGWNAVLFYYCSSDHWVGTNADHVFSEAEPSYRVDFRGADLVDEGLAALQAGLSSDDASQSLPSLGAADRVVFSGASAGGLGAIHHADHVAETLPGAQVLAVLDASMVYAASETLGDSAAAVETQSRAVYDNIAGPLWEARFDADCMASEETWRCGDTDVVLRRHLSVPVLVVHDLFDPVIFAFYAVAGMSSSAYASAVEDSLRLYARDHGASVIGRTCHQHQALEDDGKFLAWTVVDLESGGQAWTVHDAMQATLDGQQVVAVDGPLGRGSTCR